MDNRGKRDVVVTGIGILSPLGADSRSTWKKILDGTCGIRVLESPVGFGRYLIRQGGRVVPHSLPAFVNAREASRLPPYMRFGLVAADEAFRDAGLSGANQILERMGVVAGSVCGGAEVIHDSIDAILSRGPRAVSPRFVMYAPINMLAGELSVRLGLKGPQLALSTHGTTGINAIGRAQRIIQYGDADIMLAGASDAPLSDIIAAAFAADGSLSPGTGGTKPCLQPFGSSRDGTVLSEGAAMLVLEERGHAERRGAHIYAQLAGYASTCDAHDRADPSPHGEGLARAMRLAIRDAGMHEGAVHYVSAYGESSLRGDRAECDAIERVFRSSPRPPMVSAPKSQLGHLMGAAGAIEAALTVLAVRDQQVPPTLGVEQQGAGCIVDISPQLRSGAIDFALSNSYGYGGNNAVLAWKRALTPDPAAIGS